MASEKAEQATEQVMPPRSTIVAPGHLFGVASDPMNHARTTVVIDLSPEARDMLNNLMNLTRDTPSDLFRKALALYKVASEAHREGFKVGTAKSADSLEAEFVGF